MCWPARRSSLLPDYACQQCSTRTKGRTRRCGPAFAYVAKFARDTALNGITEEQLNFAQLCSK